jgi:hypothetical protein
MGPGGNSIEIVIDRFLSAENWDEPHPDMDIEESYGVIVATLADLVAVLAKAEAEGCASDEFAGLASVARRILVRAPALVNVLLNYKICAEHGLPFHPTVYYELAEARRYNYPHPIDEIEGSNRLYRESIDLARAAYRLVSDFPVRARAFAARLPSELSGFVYTGACDKYTWRGTEPAKVERLVRLVTREKTPDLIVAAAHGSIMPGLLLAEYLDRPLYFVRFSMFKRQDLAPIVSFADEAWLSAWAGGSVLLFDEDVAGGTTLTRFAERLSPLFREAKTACVIRHAGASIRPDYVGQVWYD